jgi:hypothetical protein
MEEALAGDCPKWRYRTRPAKWLGEHWVGGEERS